MKKQCAFFFICCLISLTDLFAQTYTPVAVTGFNFDAIAENAPNASASTTGTMDGSNHVMYSVNFAAGAGFTGGVINSGTIVNGTRTYQLRPFNGTNAVYIANGTTKTITLTTPAPYSLVSLLIFSTEGNSNINVTFNYVGGTTTNFGASTILDWFAGTGSVYCCFGRCTRVTSGSVCDGVPNNPNFYPLDFSLSCADQQKNLQSITINTTSGNQGAWVMAVSGAAYVQTNTVAPVVNVSCNGGTDGSATASITGVNSPFTYSWNSAPVQTTATASNLPVGNYTCTVSDNKGCISTTTVTITEPPVLTLTTTPTNASCGANNGSISATAGGGTSPYTYSINGGAFSGSANFPNLGAGTYTITLQDNNNCQTSAITTITMSGSTNVTVNSASICSGDSVVLTANGATAYSWSPGTGLSSTSGATVTAIPSTTTIYTITGTAGACTGSVTATITVTPTPTVTVNNATVCAGNSATLNANGATTYSWSPATGLSSTTGASVTGNPVGTTTYIVTGTNGVCFSSNTSIVVVNLLPAISVASATTCIGTPATLTASGATTYTWNTLGTGASITLSPNITTTYTVVGTDNNSCANFATGTITVNTLPTITANNIAICNGTSGTLTASGAASYTWNPSAGLSSSTGSMVTANPNSTSSYTVTATDANGCVGNATSNVTVHSLPVVTATSINICQGSFGVLSAGGAITYSWNPSTGLSNSNGASVTANPNATTNYTVVGADANGCMNIATATITVNSSPQISISPLISSGCAPLCVSFSNTTIATGLYNWNFNDGHASTSATPRNCFIGQGSYNVSLTFIDGNGCKQTTTALVTVFPSPHADFNPTPQPTSILEPKVTFINTSTGSLSNTWNWNFGDLQNTTSTIQNPTFVYTGAGEYAVELVVVSSNGCRDSIIRIIKIDSEDVIYVPNAFSPNGDGTNDIFMPKGEGLTDYKLSIYDRWGNQVFTSNDLYKGWDGQKGNDIVQQDVYVWKIELKDSNGQSRQFSGIVSLIK